MRRLAIAFIRFYRWFRGRYLRWLPAMCRYTPSCSTYGLIAYQRHGFMRASWLTSWRLMRCNPWSAGGYDPVPARKDGRPDPEGTPAQPRPNARARRLRREHDAGHPHGIHQQPASKE